MLDGSVQEALQGGRFTGSRRGWLRPVLVTSQVSATAMGDPPARPILLVAAAAFSFFQLRGLNRRRRGPREAKVLRL